MIKIIYEIKGKPIHTPKIEENKTEIFIKEKGKFEELINDQPLAKTTKEKTKSDKLKINNCKQARHQTDNKLN